MSNCKPSSIQTFEFESHHVRTVTGPDGEPWFVAKEVCDALGLSNSRMATSRLDDDERGTVSIADGIPGNPTTTIVSESGVYRLIFTSRSERATAFKRWLAHDVLPAIRKTGSYTAPSAPPAAPMPALLPAAPGSLQDTVASIVLLGNAMAGVPGLQEGMRWAKTLQTVTLKTGIPTDAFAQLLPASTDPGRLTPTALGKPLGMSAKRINMRLLELGFQRLGEKDRWVLTEAGAEYGEMVPFVGKNGHADYRPMWRAKVRELLQPTAAVSA
ncbi:MULTISPECIES: BRO-N domain-containing protein [unclassified Corallococcus]|uniref:BRO-N domain-containing protein n=1 Tax=unclassified Corallococcus TaxID=2685029 RepID=UPI001A8F4406|nr:MULTISPECIES: BRO family protein [unclassified Corallococcus]MBN9687115.1 hypothetical protein [Corallococcus sp. NCSPR001]WAS89057.1 BRO family protein [Corallococcus sp. NCRR]